MQIIRMEKSFIFRSRFSRWIAGLYWGLLALLGIILLGVPILAGLAQPLSAIFVAVFDAIFIMFFLMLTRAYRMKFVITGSEIVIRGIFKTNRIRRSDIKEVKKSPIPFGFRLFGASFLGGWVYIPGMGKGWLNMTNFSDGVLITTKSGGLFIITPERPQEFVKLASRRKQ